MKYKSERFRVAGVSHYADDIMSKLSYENDDFSCTTKQLSEAYDVGDRIFEYSFDDCRAALVPEPTNEYDSNAIRVEVGGVLIGYVKKGSCSHVKNLLKSPDFNHIEVNIGGGKYKRLYEDDDRIKVECDSCELFADLYIYTRQPDQETEQETKPRLSQDSVSSVASSAAPDPAPVADPPKGSGAASVLSIIAGIIILFFSLCLIASSAPVAGIFFLIIGIVFLNIGIKWRKSLKR